MAMFPPAIPHVFINWLTEPNDVVYDPFSGRGSTALEACLLGRTGFASDANPLACVLSGAKVDPPSFDTLQRRLAELEQAVAPYSVELAPDHVRIMFSKRTLGQLLWLRDNLSMNRRSDRFIMALLLGVLHANADRSGMARGLTVAMPNTFSMSPGYIARYIETHRLQAPKVDVFEKLRGKAFVLATLPTTFARGAAWLRDASQPPSGPIADRRAKLLFSSPPYLEVMRYGKLNWIRLWLLKESPREVDKALFTSSSISKYIDFMRRTISAARQCVSDDGFACFVIGDVHRRSSGQDINLVHEVAANCVRGSGFRVLGIVDDHLPIETKVSRIWGATKGNATRVDRVLILGAPKAELPRFRAGLEWSSEPT